MLNLVTFDVESSELLERSFDAFADPEAIEIITDPVIKEQLLKQVTSSIDTTKSASFVFQNLFRFRVSNGTFYVAQCHVDFFSPLAPKGVHFFGQSYNLQLIGIANLTVDLGVTNLRLETRLDRVVDRFFSSDIDFEGAEKFNQKYYLVSNNKQQVLRYFDRGFLDTIAKHDDILLATNGKQMFLSFDEWLTPDQSRRAQEILSSFRYLAAE